MLCFVLILAIFHIGSFAFMCVLPTSGKIPPLMRFASFPFFLQLFVLCAGTVLSVAYNRFGTHVVSGGVDGRIIVRETVGDEAGPLLIYHARSAGVSILTI